MRRVIASVTRRHSICEFGFVDTRRVLSRRNKSIAGRKLFADTFSRLNRFRQNEDFLQFLFGKGHPVTNFRIERGFEIEVNR